MHSGCPGSSSSPSSPLYFYPGVFSPPSFDFPTPCLELEASDFPLSFSDFIYRTTTRFPTNPNTILLVRCQRRSYSSGPMRARTRNYISFIFPTSEAKGNFSIPIAIGHARDSVVNMYVTEIRLFHMGRVGRFNSM